jgi:hypothetical protein
MVVGNRMRTKRTRRILAVATAVVVGALALGACKAPPPLGAVNAQGATAPQWPLLSDPAVLAANGKYYVYGSNSFVRLPVTTVSSLTAVDAGTWFWSTKEAMPTAPPWVVGNVLWAPTVARGASGYVLFFAAHRANPPDPANDTCIGRATSPNADGPFVPEAVPFSCGLDGTGGALDPFLFHGPDGIWYLYAAFGNTENPIYAFVLDANLDHDRDAGGYAGYWPWPVYGKKFAWEGRFIENPSMTYDSSTGTYLLAYSAGDWWTPGYSTGLARCSAPLGLCVGNAAGPWLASGNGRTGPGGLSFFAGLDGTTKAAYATFPAGGEGIGQPRAGTVAGVSGGWTPSLGAP